jgi:hypothetical protein
LHAVTFHDGPVVPQGSQFRMLGAEHGGLDPQRLVQRSDGRPRIAATEAGHARAVQAHGGLVVAGPESPDPDPLRVA